MTLAQVQAVVALISALILSWAALLMAVALTLPEQTARAEAALVNRPKQCFAVGFGMAILLIIALISFRIPPLILPALIGSLSIGAVLVVGAAGVAKLMGTRIAKMSGWESHSFGNLVKGSLVYSVAMLFPLIGWYLFLPISLLGAMGAGLLALWPRRKTMPASPPRSEVPTMDFSGAA